MIRNIHGVVNLSQYCQLAKDYPDPDPVCVEGLNMFLTHKYSLKEVSYHPTVGIFLTNFFENILPDEKNTSNVPYATIFQ